MKFRWEHDHNAPDVNLHDLDKERKPGTSPHTQVVGWVQRHLETPSRYQVRFVWTDYDDREDIMYPTKLQAMRALRTAYRMYVIGGGKQK